MVGAVLFLLLCALIGQGEGDLHQDIANTHKYTATAQIHYQFCDRKYTCLIPSKYFGRVEEKSLQITYDTDKQFLDGMEIQVVSSSTWYLTLMANNSDSSIQFTWAGREMMKCTIDTVANTVMFETPDSIVTTMQDRTLEYVTTNGTTGPAMICKYKLEKRPHVTDRTMANIFAAMVHATNNQSMCFNVIGAFNESYCNDIDELRPNMRLSYNPLDCTGCPLADSVCKQPGNCAVGHVPLTKEMHSGCETFFSLGKMLVNNQAYSEPGTNVFCHQKRWVMKTYDPFPSWDNPYDEKTYAFDKITSVTSSPKFKCQFSSPLKNICPLGKECDKIRDWTAPIKCADPYQLTYFGQRGRNNLDNTLPLSEATCNDQGVWIGHASEGNQSWTLKTGESIVCLNTDMNEMSIDSLDDFDLVAGEKKDPKARNVLFRDNAVDYTSAVVVCAIVGVVSAILLIVGVVVISSCVGSMRGPVGLPRSERSQRPIAAAGEEEMSFSDRISLVFT